MDAYSPVCGSDALTFVVELHGNSGGFREGFSCSVDDYTYFNPFGNCVFIYPEEDKAVLIKNSDLTIYTGIIYTVECNQYPYTRES